MIDIEEFPPENDSFAIKIEELNKKASFLKTKKEAIDNLTVVVHGVEYSGDDVSQNRMGNTLAIANWKFNQAIGTALKHQAEILPDDHPAKKLFDGLGDNFNGIYYAVYKDTKLDWKNAKNKISHIEAESVGEGLYKIMLKVGEAIKKAVL